MSHCAGPGSVTTLKGKTCGKGREESECYGCSICSRTLQVTRRLICHFSPAKEGPATQWSLKEKDDSSPDKTDVLCTCQRADDIHKTVTQDATYRFSDGAGSNPT